MASRVIEYLRELVTLTGPSGAEEEVARTIARLARPLADGVELDAFGNLIVTRQAARTGARRLLLAAHMDEVGLLARAIDAEGFLRFERVGGVDHRILLAQRVWVRGSRGRLLGVIGAKSAHLLRERDRLAAPEEGALYIDIGARDAADAARMGVRVGDPIGFVGELAELGRESGRYTAHALDDRAGCAILLALLEELRGVALSVTVICLFTVQEEVGVRGAQAAAHGIPCDLALAVDMTALDDTPDTATGHLRLGAGPAIKIMDGHLLAHPAARRVLEEAAERAGIGVQREILKGIGTDAAALQFGGAGTIAGALSVGNRYTHSPTEVFDLTDLEQAVTILRHLPTLVATLDLRFTTLA